MLSDPNNLREWAVLSPLLYIFSEMSPDSGPEVLNSSVFSDIEEGYHLDCDPFKIVAKEIIFVGL